MASQYPTYQNNKKAQYYSESEGSSDDDSDEIQFESPRQNNSKRPKTGTATVKNLTKYDHGDGRRVSRMSQQTISLQAPKKHKKTVIVAKSGNDLMQSVSLPKLQKDDLPELCLCKIERVEEVNVKSSQRGQKPDTAMSFVLRPIVAEGVRGEIIKHNDAPIMVEGERTIKQFVSYLGVEIPETFTIWVPRSLKETILSGKWENPEQCYIYVLPVCNRYHPLNMYQQNISLRYHVYFPCDLQNFLVTNGIDDNFDFENPDHLQVALDDVIKKSQRELSSNTVACRRYNVTQHLDTDSNLKPMEKFQEKLRAKQFYLHSLAPNKKSTQARQVKVQPKKRRVAVIEQQEEEIEVFQPKKKKRTKRVTIEVDDDEFNTDDTVVVEPLPPTKYGAKADKRHKIDAQQDDNDNEDDDEDNEELEDESPKEYSSGTYTEVTEVV